jgi:isopenicillin N synthase-like dioxygenase
MVATDHLDFWPICAKQRMMSVFYLTGHGITAKQREEILAVAHKFLISGGRQRVEMIHSPHFAATPELGGVDASRPDWREQFDINSERVPLWRSSGGCGCGPNQWPRRCPSSSGVARLAGRDD